MRGVVSSCGLRWMGNVPPSAAPSGGSCAATDGISSPDSVACSLFCIRHRSVVPLCAREAVSSEIKGGGSGSAAIVRPCQLLPNPRRSL